MPAVASGRRVRLLATLVGKGVHLLFHDVRELADGALEELGVLDERHADFLIAIGARHFARAGLQVLPRRNMRGQHVVHSTNGLDLLRHASTFFQNPPHDPEQHETVISAKSAGTAKRAHIGERIDIRGARQIRQHGARRLIVQGHELIALLPDELAVAANMAAREEPARRRCRTLRLRARSTLFGSTCSFSEPARVSGPPARAPARNRAPMPLWRAPGTSGVIVR